MTPEEFDAVDRFDERFRYELIQEVLVVSPIPLVQETAPNECLGFLVRSYQQAHEFGNRLDATLPQQYVRIGKQRRIADRVLWIGLGRCPDLAVDVPKIAIEFVSAAKRDRDRDYVEKRKEYRKAGVAEYWVIDRFRRTMTVFLGNGKKKLIAENEVYVTPLLPGFELPLSKVLAVADAWKSAKKPRRKS